MSIRTVLEDIAPEELGVCYSHEHIIIDPSYATDQNPDFLLDSVENGASELAELRQLGVGAVVDSMPCDCGRNITKLAEISRRSGVRIIAPTGLHLPKYYVPEVWQKWMKLDADAVSEHFQTEIERGVENTGLKAGIIKVASPARWNDETEKIFAAAALAHRKTGCPILTHTEEGQLADVQSDLFSRYGVDCRHVVLSHLDRNADIEYQRAVLQRGVTIEYDSHFRWKNRVPNPTLELLKTLLPEFPDQIVLGMDAARRSYWKAYGGAPGLAYLYTDFKQQMLEAGLGEELVHKVFVTTPARVYSFKEKT